MLRITLRTTIVVALLAATGAGAALAASPDPRGFIYGTVETTSDVTYRGLLRWGTEEAFWDDLFNSTKEELPYMAMRGRADERRREIRVFGVTVGYRGDHDHATRQLVMRFGDIREIVPRRGDRVDVVLRDGSTRTFDGGSNDIGAKIRVLDESLGEVRVDWKRIERIVFEAAPRRVEPPARRLHGTVHTDGGAFTGFVQWDLQECLSTDELDGDTRDGDVSIEMGRIASIEKRNRKGSTVRLRDGRELVLEDSNDVDASLRGIFVEDERFGRVEIPWEAFERVEFDETASSGRGYGDYGKPKRLEGTVVDYDGRKSSGTIVFDLDEEESWEILHGTRDGIEYLIPFERIRSVEPRRGGVSLVTLRGGERLELEESQDVSESNDGVVVLRGGEDGREVYLPWRDVKKVEFD